MREPGWNLFHELPESRLTQGTGNYTYSLPFDNNQEVTVKGGVLELGGKKILPHAQGFVQKQENFETVSVFNNLYEGIDVTF